MTAAYYAGAGAEIEHRCGIDGVIAAADAVGDRKWMPPADATPQNTNFIIGELARLYAEV